MQPQVSVPFINLSQAFSSYITMFELMKLCGETVVLIQLLSTLDYYSCPILQVQHRQNCALPQVFIQDSPNILLGVGRGSKDFPFHKGRQGNL